MSTPAMEREDVVRQDVPGNYVLEGQKYKRSSNQVAGHRFEEGHLGSLVDDSGRFYKPIQSGDRGDQEIAFYEQFWTDPAVPPTVARFFSGYYGTAMIDCEDGRGPYKHLVMDDLTLNYVEPSIIDVKIGKRTWYPGASEEYIKKRRSKDASTTSGALGFRIAGMQVYEAASKSVWRAERNWCRERSVDNIGAALERFTSLHPSAGDGGADPALTAEVYGGEAGVLQQLQLLRQWFDYQTGYHFCSSSILISYEGNMEAEAPRDGKRDGPAPPAQAAGGDLPDGMAVSNPRRVQVHLVDFANVRQGDGAVDSNFLQGLDSFIAFASKMLERLQQEQ